MNSSTIVPIRVAIIGAGTVSQSNHIPSLMRAGFDVVTVCDLSPSRAAQIAKRFGIAASTSPAEVLADPNVDAVVIATPGTHTELAKAAIAGGKHVLAEKPLALTIAEVEELEQLAAAAGTVVQVGYMKMYDALTERARLELDQLEDVRLVRITVAHPDDKPQTQHLRMTQSMGDADVTEINRANEYELQRAHEALGNASDEIINYYRTILNGSVVHELSLLRALGFPLPTVWNAEAFPALGGATPASLLATGAVGDVRYVLSWNWLPEYPEYDEELKVLASNGRLEYHLGKPYLLDERSLLRVERNDGTERRDVTYTEGFESGFIRQLDAFAASILDGAPVRADLAGVKEDIACLQALVKAIAATAGYPISTEVDARSAQFV